MSKPNSRCCYTEYVEHMIRFFLAYPAPLRLDGHTAVDANNWIAVQSVFCDLDDKERDLLTDLYTCKITPFREAVAAVCEKRSINPGEAWNLVAVTQRKIARVRGLA